MGIVPGLKRATIDQLSTLLHDYNSYVRQFKIAKDILESDEAAAQQWTVVIHEEKRPAGEHARRFNAQACDEVGIIMPVDLQQKSRYIGLRLRDGQLKKISELHPAYDPLQYPLLFPHGTQGYSINMPQQGGGRKLTMMRFTAYHIMAGEGNNLIKGRRLYQQYLVDAYCKVETERLQYLRREQSKLRADCYQNVRDTLLVTDGDTNNVGRRVVLPATFHGGPRYMHERQMDAMAYVRKYGRPDLFVTMTTNPKWDEVTSNLLPGQEPQDRPELISRVFALKLNKLMKFLEGGAFGQLQCWLYSIEFQKRGLPHVHILLWLSAAHKMRPDDIDKAISAEFPCPQTDPELHAIVTKNMVHGPCGVINRNSPTTLGFYVSSTATSTSKCALQSKQLNTY